jgi:hypothetical protein
MHDDSVIWASAASETPVHRKPSFRELGMPETELPRITVVGSLVNSANGTVLATSYTLVASF